ncbi:MAG: radical SAM protein, partial [Myxococcota bacterium]
MRRLRIGILDLIATRPTHSPYARLMHPNFHSIMPQAVGVWAEELGHDVHYLSFTGSENLRRTLPSDIDLLFVGSFTPSAYLAYAISSLYRSQGVVTVLGGPHARAYAEDARLHFDYVLGLVDKPLIRDLLQGFSRHRALGVRLGALRQPETVPSLRQRWRFTRHNLDKAPLNGVVM